MKALLAVLPTSVKADEARPLPYANSMMRLPSSSGPLASSRDARLVYREAAKHKGCKQSQRSILSFQLDVVSKMTCIVCCILREEAPIKLEHTTPAQHPCNDARLAYTQAAPSGKLCNMSQQILLHTIIIKLCCLQCLLYLHLALNTEQEPHEGR